MRDLTRLSRLQRMMRIISATSLVSVLAISLASVYTPTTVFAQDPGIPDTVYVPDVDVDAGDQFMLPMRLVNDEDLAGGTLGLCWGTSDLTLDSITYVGTRLGFLPIGQTPSSIDNFNHSGLSGFFIILPPTLTAGSGVFANFWFSVDPGAPDQFVDIDSCFVPPSGDFILIVHPTNASFRPQFVGGTVKIGNPSEPPTIAVAPDSFYFEATQGQANPPTQALNITNVGLGTLNWSATKTQTWLGVSPSSGVAPSVTQISANSISLAAGDYFDTITVSDPMATNNPVTVPVHLHVKVPPPTISVSQTTYNFNAIADSTNPPPQTLIIKNTGDGVLNWTATNSTSWLDVTPTVGVDSTDVTLEVDITGLPFGSYKDTVVISDPAATNSPRRVFVNLTVASDLPILKLEPETLTVVVDLTPAPPSGGGASGLVFDTGYVDILNDGAGALTYTATESSTRILTMTPSTGSAPQQMQLVFRNSDGQAPGDLYDSVLVTSPEAVNSPQTLIIKFHFTANPAHIVALPDTLKFELYECEQGSGFVPQIRTLTLQNFGEVVPFTLTHTSSWLFTVVTGGNAPRTVTFTIAPATLTALPPVGTYIDTITINSPLSETNPVKAYAKLTIKPTDQIAIISPNFVTVTLPAREGTNFQYCPITVETIKNFRPGCFSWEINESIPWLNFTSYAGVNPGSAAMLTDGTGLTFGSYNGSFQISSAEAQNSPVNVNVTLKVWRLFGDADYNNVITIADVVYLIQYIFNSGPTPQPCIEMGDVDCTGTVNIADVTYLLGYIFRTQNQPCGNDEIPTYELSRK